MSTSYYFRDLKKWEQHEKVGAFLEQRINEYMEAAKAFIEAHPGEACADAVEDAESHITTTIGMELCADCIDSDEEFLTTSGNNQFQILAPGLFCTDVYRLEELIRQRLQSGYLIVDEYEKVWRDADEFVADVIGKLKPR